MNCVEQYLFGNDIYFACDKCSFKSKSNVLYNKHINNPTIHSKDNIFCSVCSKKYKSLSGLWRHKKECKSSITEYIINDFVGNELEYIEEIMNQKTEPNTILSQYKKHILRLIKELDLARQQLKDLLDSSDILNKLNTKYNQTIDFLDMIKKFRINIDYKELLKKYDEDDEHDNVFNLMYEFLKKEFDKIPMRERSIYYVKEELKIYIKSGNEWEIATEADVLKELFEENYNCNIKDENEHNINKHIILKGFDILNNNLFDDIRTIYKNDSKFLRVHKQNIQGHEIGIVKLFVKMLKLIETKKEDI